MQPGPGRPLSTLKEGPELKFMKSKLLHRKNQKRLYIYILQEILQPLLLKSMCSPKACAGLARAAHEVGSFKRVSLRKYSMSCTAVVQSDGIN